MAKERVEKSLPKNKSWKEEHAFSPKQLEEAAVVISTDSLIFDIFLGGGYSCGIARFGAPPEHGKTVQGLVWAKNWLNHWGDKGRVIYFDCEGRLTPKKLKLSGISDVKDFNERVSIFVYNVYEDIGEDIFEMTSNNPEGLHYFIVFDSLDMMISEKDMNKTLKESEKVGAAQTISTVLMKKVGPYLASRGHHLYICSQIRANINTSAHGNGPKTKMSGGNAIAHATNIGGEIQKNFGGNEGMFIFENPMGKTVKEKGKTVGHYHTIKFIKTMNEKTGQVIRIPIKRGSGIWREREVTDLSLAFGQITKRASWFEMKPEFAALINESIQPKLKESFVERNLKEFAKTGASKADLKKKKEDLEKEAEALKFDVETKWQGYENLFSYIESTPILVQWLDDYYRKNAISDSVVIETDNDEEPIFE